MLTTSAPAKVNLCLLVGAPRPDGLHPLVSVVQPVSLADEVTLEPADDARRRAGAGGEGAGERAGDSGRRGVARDEVVCPGVDGENLAARALAGFRAATGWAAPPRRLTIAKRIPVAAGMAGGSADAAAALRLAAVDSGLDVPPGLPMSLGADVPVMLRAARALMTGAGEHVEELPGGVLALLVVPLDAALATRDVYRAFDEVSRPRSAGELAEAAVALRSEGTIPDELAVNDLEPVARRLCPAIEAALTAAREAGAKPVMVTGSGPTVFGVVADADAEAAAARVRAAGFPRAVAATAVGPDRAMVRRP